jgi:hypothetical protein
VSEQSITIPAEVRDAVEAVTRDGAWGFYSNCYDGDSVQFCVTNRAEGDDLEEGEAGDLLQDHLEKIGLN